MATGRNAKMGRNRFADIGIGVANADHARLDAGTEAHDGHALAGVIRAAPGGIAAVVSCQQHHVARFQLPMHLRQTAIKGFECRRIARHVTPMAKEHGGWQSDVNAKVNGCFADQQGGVGNRIPVGGFFQGGAAHINERKQSQRGQR